MDTPLRVLDESKQGGPFTIRPEEITLREYGETQLSTFGMAEAEEAAGRLVSFFQSKGRWCAFTAGELVDFYRSRGWDEKRMLYGLIGAYMHQSGIGFRLCQPPTYIVLFSDGKYCVTDLFVMRCFSGIKDAA